MIRRILILLFLLTLFGCHSKKEEIQVGPFILTDISTYRIDASRCHIVLTITCASDLTTILSSLDMKIDHNLRVNLLRHQTFPPGASLLVYRMNIQIPERASIQFEGIANGKVVESEPIDVSTFVKDMDSTVVEQTLGKEEITRFLGKTY
ncbi:MAG TPA: hypothetical protein PK014_06375 [Thermoanaerobaculia bacterium]|nr:hypothetical protein [Thermoanaerobaculia bacterium]HUM29378.1 hypothetical protein [Thermoanaerobaculia bacterium]HXK67624.1 hypothetical protein [Thermoanaerobaculia bacterium]